MTSGAGLTYKKNCFITGIHKKICSLVFCYALYLGLHAQLTPNYIFKFDKINTGVKPFNQTVLCMAQDSIGFMWFGTSNGLYRYDGNSFVLFEFEELKGIEIRALTVDSQKNIWIATTWDQLYKYNAYSQTLQHYIYDTATIGRNISQIFKICQGKNNTMWLASGEGLLQLNTITGKFTVNKNIVARSMCVLNDTLYTGLVTGGIKCFNITTAAELTTAAGWAFLAGPNYTVTCLYTGSNNSIWAGTNLGLFKRSNNGQITNFVNMPGHANSIPDNTVNGITGENNNGFLWVCTPRGIALYEEAKAAFVPIQSNVNTYTTSIIEKHAVCVYTDVSGKIWIGTAGSGIFSFFPRKIKVYRNIAGNANSIHSNELKRVFLFNNNLLASVYTDGIDIIDLITNTCKFYPFTNTLNAAFSKIQYPSARDNSSLFVGSTLGLFVFDVYRHTYAEALPAQFNSLFKNVNAALYDHNGDLWIGCEETGGLYKFNSQTQSLHRFNLGSRGLISENVNQLATDTHGNVVACVYSTVQKYSSGADSFLYLKQNGQMLPSSAGICFYARPGGISYCGTYQNGIFITNDKLEVLANITETNGLSANSILSFLPEDDSTIWAASTWGVNKIAFGKKQGKNDYTITHFDNSDGLPGELVINMVPYTRNGEKEYFLSTNDGLVEVSASEFTPNSFVPPVVITGLSIADTAILPLDSSHILSVPVYLTKTVHLYYNQNSFQLTFAALNYINTEKNQYAYMLQGVDKDWRYTSSIYSASYSNLRPGTYTFLVKASNDAGVWNSQPAHLQFIIKPPFWETIWAYLLYAITIAGAIYAIYLNRIKQYRAKQETQLRTMIATQEQERKRISRDLHDDVGTKLSALKLFVSTFKNNLQKQNYAETQTLAQSTEELIDETIHDVRIMLMNLSPGILEEFGYVTAVEGLVNKINETKALHIELVIFGIKERFAKDYELTLYRMTQELVNNILKHAAAKNVSLQIGYRNEKIILMAEDDGKGFIVTEHKEGYGLNNLEARTKLLQGILTIDSSPGNGTSVLIEVPYQFS